MKNFVSVCMAAILSALVLTGCDDGATEVAIVDGNPKGVVEDFFRAATAQDYRTIKNNTILEWKNRTAPTDSMIATIFIVYGHRSPILGKVYAIKNNIYVDVDLKKPDGSGWEKQRIKVEKVYGEWKVVLEHL